MNWPETDEIDELVDWQLSQFDDESVHIMPMFVVVEFDDRLYGAARWTPTDGWGWVLPDGSWAPDPEGYWLGRRR